MVGHCQAVLTVLLDVVHLQVLPASNLVYSVQSHNRCCLRYVKVKPVPTDLVMRTELKHDCDFGTCNLKLTRWLLFLSGMAAIQYHNGRRTGRRWCCRTPGDAMYCLNERTTADNGVTYNQKNLAISAEWVSHVIV
jgi:hypothetical protein